MNYLSRILFVFYMTMLAATMPSHAQGQVKLRPVFPQGEYNQLMPKPSSFPVIHEVPVVQETPAGKQQPAQSVTGEMATTEGKALPERKVYRRGHALTGGNIETFKVEGVTFRMVKVKGGRFIMGATEEQGEDAGEDERPAHEVQVQDFYIAETEVTQELWEAVMGFNPSHSKGPKLPVESIRYRDIDLFLMKLEFFTGQRFRLPAEAEWEFAARGGLKSRHTKYAGSDDYEAVAWYCNNSGNHSHDVATKAPNELGIYDMSGNVEEWCEDLWKPYAQGADGEETPNVRVRRGGGFLDFATHLRVSDRRGATHTIFTNDIGLRLAF